MINEKKNREKKFKKNNRSDIYFLPAATSN